MKNTDKFGRFCPGSDIVIKDEKELLNDQPDYLIIMPYSFIDEFIKKESNILRGKTQMITLVPDIRIYTKNLMSILILGKNGFFGKRIEEECIELV